MSIRPANIIRHKHTRAFTVIANDVLNDARLSLDEKGLLCWFLSLPEDWEVIPAHVRKTHNLGRDKYHRIMKSLRTAGYVELVVERSETDGTICCVRHVVSDIATRSDPAIPEERVDADVESAIEAADGDEPAIPESQESVASLQQPENPDVVDHPVTRSPENPESGKPGPGISNKDLENTPPTPQAVPPASRNPPTFRALCAKWPSDRIVTVSAAERRFLRLSEERRQLAFDGVERFLAQTRAKGWKICDLQTYLRDRRWEAVKGGPPAANSVAAPGSPQAERWLAYWEAIGHPTAFARQQIRLGRSITTPTEWPPPLPAQSSDAAKKAS